MLRTEGISTSFVAQIQSSVVPSEYVWYWDTPTVVSATERLQVNVGESVEVRLPFPFTWFGIQYEHVFVTACGYIRFDQGDDTDMFRAARHHSGRLRSRGFDIQMQ